MLFATNRSTSVSVVEEIAATARLRPLCRYDVQATWTACRVERGHAPQPQSVAPVVARSEKIGDHDAQTGLGQMADDIGADKPGTAGDDDQVVARLGLHRRRLRPL
jgi:hypothetical protein